MKKKNLCVMLGTMIFLGSALFAGSKDVEAAKWKSFLEYPGIENVSTNPVPVVPGDYATLFRWSSKIRYKVVGNNSVDGTEAIFRADTFDKSKEHYVLYENIGIYGGEYVDLKINIENLVSPSDKNGRINVYMPKTKADAADEFLRIDMRRTGVTMNLSHEVYIHGTNKQIPFKGIWNYQRVNRRKSVILSTDVNDIPDLYTYGDTELEYHTEYPGVFEVMGDTQNEKPQQSFSAIFDTHGTGLKQSGELIATNLGYLKYNQTPITKSELPTPQIVGEKTNFPKVEYIVAQDMPIQAKREYYPLGYKLYIDLDESVDINTAKVRVEDIDGKSAQNQFSITPDVKNHRLMISTNPTNLSDLKFVDNSYLFNVSADLKLDVDLSEKYKEDGFFHIPGKVHYETPEYNSKENSSDALVKAILRAKGKQQTVPQGSNTSEWKNKKVLELFEYAYGTSLPENIEIVSVENKMFTKTGVDRASVTLKDKTSGLTGIFEVPVNVLEKKTATIHYIDSNGKEISDVIKKTGFEKEAYDYTSEKKDISNYTFVKVDEGKGSPLKGTYPSAVSDIHIYLEYKMNDQLVTMKYVDEKGSPISKEVTNKYAPMKDQSIDSVVIPGYQVDSVKIDNTAKSLSEGGKVIVPVKDKPVTVIFTYKSIHYKMNLSANKASVSPRGEVDYALEIKSGMTYLEEIQDNNYKNAVITIPVDSKIDNVKDIKIVNSAGDIVGKGQFDKNASKITANLTKDVKDTENLNVTYTVSVKNEVTAGDKISMKASMTSDYQVNGETKNISKNSNTVDVTVKASDQKSVTIHYLNKTGEEISKNTGKIGYELQSYDFKKEIKAIDGYKFVEIDETKGLPISGTFSGGSGDEHIYVIYDYDELKVTTNYVDEKGTSIFKKTEQKLLSGRNHSIDSVVVPGYKVKSAKVDNQTVALSDDGRVTISVMDKPVSITFTYEAIHYTMKLKSDKASVSPKGIIDYTLEIKSGMVYPEGTPVEDYKNVTIKIPIDTKVDSIKDIKVLNAKDEVIGKGEYVAADGQIVATLTKEVKNTEEIKVIYTAIAKNEVKAGDKIETTASMKATYQVDGENREMTNKSNKSTVIVKESDEKTTMIHYVDSKGTELADSETKIGYELQDYDYTNEIKTISGYKYLKVDETKGLPIKGTFAGGKEDENIFVVYELDEFPVSVNFMDQDGLKISNETIKKYVSGKDYILSSVNMPGYKLRSVKVDGQNKQLTEGDKVTISVKDKPISVIFNYESIHYSLELNVDKASISQNDTLKYVLDVKSGMKYSNGSTPENYANVTINIPIDSHLENIKDIKVLDSKGQKIGVGQYDNENNKLTATLTETIKDTENLKIEYTATVKTDAKTDEIVTATGTMKADYKVNGESREISRESNSVRTTIAGGLRIVSAPETIDFGKVTYQAKKISVDNPSINDRLVVSDTRSNTENGWQLNVALVVPLTKTTGEVLDGQIIYKNGKDEHELTSAEYPIYTKKATDQTNVDVTDSWGNTDKSDGIKLKFESTNAPKTGAYTGKIRWTLMAGQP